MKKIFSLAALVLVAALFVGCDMDRLTPTHDSTKLWPAQDPTGTTLMSETGNWGFINEKGKFVIPGQYYSVGGFSCGYARVWLGETAYFVDKKGELHSVAPFEEVADFYYNYAVGFSSNWYCGLLNRKMELAIQPTFDDLGSDDHGIYGSTFSVWIGMGDNGLLAARLTSSGKYGYVNTKGDFQIQPMYDEAGAFKAGVAVVRSGGKYGAIDGSGDFVISPIYDDLFNLGEGLLSYKENGRYGLLNKKGDIIVYPMYKSVGGGYGYMGNGLISVQTEEGKYGFIDTKGQMQIQPTYRDVSSFMEGYAWAWPESGDIVWLIDTKGKIVLTIQTDEWRPVTGFHNGLALLYQGADEAGTDRDHSEYRYINTKGETVYSWTCDWRYAGAPARKEKEQKASIEEMTLHFDSRKL